MLQSPVTADFEFVQTGKRYKIVLVILSLDVCGQIREDFVGPVFAVNNDVIVASRRNVPYRRGNSTQSLEKWLGEVWETTEILKWVTVV